MEGLILKAAYALAGALAGYMYGKRFTPDGFEKMLYFNLKNGKKVMVAVDNVFTSYELIDGKISMKMGELTIKETDATNSVDNNGTV